MSSQEVDYVDEKVHRKTTKAKRKNKKAPSSSQPFGSDDSSNPTPTSGMTSGKEDDVDRKVRQKSKKHKRKKKASSSSSSSSQPFIGAEEFAIPTTMSSKHDDYVKQKVRRKTTKDKKKKSSSSSRPFGAQEAVFPTLIISSKDGYYVDRKVRRTRREEADQMFSGVDEVAAMENTDAPPGRIDLITPGGNASQQEEEEDDDGKLSAFRGAQVASSMNTRTAPHSPSSSTTRGATGTPILPSTSPVATPTRLVRLEETKEPERTLTPPPPFQPWVHDEEIYRTRPGAVRVVGYTARHPMDDDDDDNTIIVGSDVDEATVARTTAFELMASAQLVNDPVIAAQVEDGDNDRRVEGPTRKVRENSERRQAWFAIGFGFVLLLAALVAVLSVVLGGKGSTSATTPNVSATIAPMPTSPTPNPTTISSLQETWIRLIQSKLSSTTFDDPASSQRLALDWITGDSYTTTTLIGQDNRIIQRFALAVFSFIQPMVQLGQLGYL